GRAALVGVGVGMTVVLQSSSAAVATTLAGLHAGTIGLEQAALLVIGQNLGTTFTAALASMGGSVPVRRTALAHILFNGGTAVVALAAFPILLGGALAVAGESDPEIAVALFHTVFNLIGVGLFLPFTPRFAGFIERLVPERGPTLTRHLDPSVAQMPAVALEAARRSATGVLFLLFGRAARILLGEDRPGGAAGATLAAQGGAALGEIRTF